MYLFMAGAQLLLITSRCRLTSTNPHPARRAGLANTTVVTPAGRGRAPGTPGDPQLRRSQNAHRRHRLRGAGRSAKFCTMPEIDRVVGNEEADAKTLGKRERRRWATSWRRNRSALPPLDASRPYPRFRAGAERLRPPLHFLHHSLWPREFALAADGRCRGSGAPPGWPDGYRRRRWTGVDITNVPVDFAGAPSSAGR